MTRSTVAIGTAHLAYWRSVPPAHGIGGSGTPRPVLLLHGLGADHAGLRPLAQAWPDTDVIAPDLPGFGDSDPLPLRHTTTNYAHALEALCAHLGLSDLVVIGHSMGANIALAFAAHHPNRVRSLILISPVTTGNGPATWPVRGYYRIGSLLPRPLARWWFLSRPAIYLADRAILTTTDRAVRRHILREDYRTAAMASARAITETYASIRRTPFAALAATVTARTVIIGTADDRLAPPDALAALHQQLPDSELVIVPDAGHLWPVEYPTTAADLIADRLSAAGLDVSSPSNDDPGSEVAWGHGSVPAAWAEPIFDEGQPHSTPQGVRVATPADAAAMLELAVAFYAEDGFTTTRDRLAEHLRHLLRSSDAHCAVVDEANCMIAFGITTLSYGLENGLIAELEDLYVVPTARRRGLAQALIDDSARWASRRGAAKLEIVIAPNGLDVSHLDRYYRARGFRDAGRRLLELPLTD
jgi:pimeloyl-ACP methyl ester carboxylesterase/GNAT superfamily N-acetyltransferase